MKIRKFKNYRNSTKISKTKTAAYLPVGLGANLILGGNSSTDFPMLGNMIPLDARSSNVEDFVASALLVVLILHLLATPLCVLTVLLLLPPIKDDAIEKVPYSGV